MESGEASSSPDTAPGQPPSPPDDGKEDSNRKKANVRKRTKTGCLTCRKRRIKCDEGRPICSNCIKSKRQCEGYNQRVVFKEPIGSFATAPYNHIALQPSSSQVLAGQLAAQAKSSSQTSPLQIIAPKPPVLDIQGQTSLQYGQLYSGQPGLSGPAPTAFAFSQSPQYGMPPPAIPHQVSPPAPLQTQGLDNHGFLPTPQTVDGGFGEHIDVTGRRTSVFPAAAQALDEPIESGIISPDFDDLEYPLSDDEISMGESDDTVQPATQSQGTFNTLVRQTQLDDPMSNFGTRIRSFSTYAERSILATYVPSPRNSPLTDPKTAAVFWHFVNVTGPSMSLYERHPMDHSRLSQSLPVPLAGYNIWTYAFPVVAFSHPALLQSMLALGSLQIAKLQKIPATAAMKHYHLAIRRMARNVRSPSRRTHPATVASSLLLAFFEVWSSDHNKWCNHLFGSSILFKEIPLGEMTRAIIPLKRRKRQRAEKERELPFDNLYSAFSMSPRSNDLDEVDVDLLSVLSGRKLTRADFGQDDDTASQGSSRYYTDRDIENYEQICDLYWWYTKMDVYQSILGGTKLFLDFDYWMQCPPRAPVGKLEAIYGTFDHLMLLLGRLVDFASKDLNRKRKAFAGRPGPGPPSGSSPPLFPGMLPTQSRFTVPMGFSPPRDASPPADGGGDDVDMEARTAAALLEWASIRQAFEALRARFSAEFEPLGREYVSPGESPFGPTLQYRTFSVAGVWMNYYMGLMHLHRAHPSMPPAAMIAAQMSAHQTNGYAIEIGRIAAGLADDCSGVTEISTLVGAAFIESCFCLFVAAIQYQHDAQRYWVVRRLYDIARLTGWQSAKQIADGCEAGWTKAHMFGRGPEYRRSPDLEKDLPPSIWISPRRLDNRIRELESSEQRMVLVKSERAHYAVGLLSVEQDLARLDFIENM